MPLFETKNINISQIDKNILRQVFNLINELEANAPDLILTQDGFFHLKNYNKSNQPEDITVTLPLIKNTINRRSENADLLQFINLLEKRAKIYHYAKSNMAAGKQYKAFALTLQSCLTQNKTLDSLESYFSPGKYYPVTLPVSKTSSNDSDSAADYIEKSRKGTIAAKIFLGIGISMLVLGAASIAFCPPLAIAAFSVGGLMIISAGLYFASPNMPNIEKIQNDEREIFELVRQLKPVVNNDNYQQDGGEQVPVVSQ